MRQRIRAGWHWLYTWLVLIKIGLEVAVEVAWETFWDSPPIEVRAPTWLVVAVLLGSCCLCSLWGVGR